MVLWGEYILSSDPQLLKCMHTHLSYSLDILCYSTAASSGGYYYCGNGTVVCVSSKGVGTATSYPICVSYIFGVQYDYCSSVIQQVSYYYWHDFFICTTTTFPLLFC